MLIVIDVLSAYTRVERFKPKSGENMIEAFEKIFKKGRRPEKRHTSNTVELSPTKQTFKAIFERK